MEEKLLDILAKTEFDESAEIAVIALEAAEGGALSYAARVAQGKVAGASDYQQANALLLLGSLDEKVASKLLTGILESESTPPRLRMAALEVATHLVVSGSGTARKLLLASATANERSDGERAHALDRIAVLGEADEFDALDRMQLPDDPVFQRRLADTVESIRLRLGVVGTGSPGPKAG